MGLALGEGSSNDSGGGEGGSYSKGVLVTLDDAIQTLTISSTNDGAVDGSVGGGGPSKPKVVHGWSSHHSPLLFSVVSECIWVDPPTAFVTTREGDKDVDGWLDGSVTTLIRNPDEVKAMIND